MLFSFTITHVSNAIIFPVECYSIFLLLSWINCIYSNSYKAGGTISILLRTIGLKNSVVIRF